MTQVGQLTIPTWTFGCQPTVRKHDTEELDDILTPFKRRASFANFNIHNNTLKDSSLVTLEVLPCLGLDLLMEELVALKVGPALVEVGGETMRVMVLHLHSHHRPGAIIDPKLPAR